jgi:phospholipid/cholesterol/gamma-HCH transport system substrate-binding protein
MSRAIRAHLGDFVAIILLVAVGLATTGYILANERFRFPYLEEKPFKLEVELADAQAVIAGQGQTVRVAGVRVGDIGQVELEDGKAVVELELDHEYEGLIRNDATALLRSKTGLKDMFLEVDPGNGDPLREGDRIPLANTAPDVDPDEFLSALDTDTRDYLKLLISGAGKGLDGHGIDLREVFKRFEPLHRDLARVTEAVARRRENLKRLVNRYGLLVEELGGKDRELTRLVQQANVVFRAFAAEDENVSAFVAKLPGALDETKTALAKADTLGDELGPTLDALRPAFRELDNANRAVIPLAEKGTPIVRDEVRPFARIAQPYTRDFGRAAGRLAEAGPDLSGAFHHFNRFFNIGAYNANGAEEISVACETGGGCTPAERNRQEGYLYWLAWIAQDTVGVFSVHDGTGPIRRVSLGGLNCQVLASEMDKAGTPPVVGDATATLFGSIGACNK